VSLRWRLTLFYGVVSGLILLLGSTALLFSLRSSLYALLDESLRDAALSVSSRFEGPGRGARGPDIRGPPLRRPGMDGLRPRLPGDTALTIFESNGEATALLDDSPVDAPLELGARSLEGYRVVTLRLRSGIWVQAARSEEDVLGALGRTRRLLFIGLPLLLMLGLGAGFVLADRALRPVDAVTRLASSIAASGRSGERVPQAIGNDEMARLTKTVNAMLEKLEGLIAQERAFALAAAHELRTPLSVLQARVSLSLERERSNEQYRAALETIGSTTRKLNGMVEGLLTLARTHVPTQGIALNLADIALEVSEWHADEARARHQHLELDLNSAPTTGDASSLRLAASNLVRNAILYGREGGHVWILTSSRDGAALLEVRDDGEGVGDEDRERLRRPFQRGQGLQAVNGSGLGLALVDAVAKQHGGQLELARAAEGGLCAAIRLPVTRVLDAS
jgi:signal transduction histidine kinase